MNLLERSAAALRLCVRKGVRMRAQATRCKTLGSPFPGADKRKDQLSAGVGGAAPMFLAAMRFMECTEARQTTRVRISAAGWDR